MQRFPVEHTQLSVEAFEDLVAPVSKLSLSSFVSRKSYRSFISSSLEVLKTEIKGHWPRSNMKTKLRIGDGIQKRETSFITK